MSSLKLFLLERLLRVASASMDEQLLMRHTDEKAGDGQLDMTLSPIYFDSNTCSRGVTTHGISKTKHTGWQTQVSTGIDKYIMWERRNLFRII